MANPNIADTAVPVVNNKVPLAASMAYQGTASMSGQLTNQLKHIRQSVPYMRRGIIVQPIPKFKSVTVDTTVQATQTGGVAPYTGGTNPAAPAFKVTTVGTRYRWPIANAPTSRS